MKIKHLRNLLAALVLAAGSNMAAADAGSVSSACASLEFMAKMLAVNTTLPANYDNPRQLTDMQSAMQELNRLACQPVLLTETTRFSSRYGNGQFVSADLYDSAWYYPNGQLFVARPGRDTPIYYPNGQVMAFRWARGGQTLYWPNGNPATFSFRTINEAWYYPDGHIITYLAGARDERWFYPFARLDGQVGQELISSHWGVDGETFQAINYTNDGWMFMRLERIRDKLVLSDAELLDVPGVLLMLTRFYQVPDAAKQFMPGDSSITDAPW
ncbi:hypothetical protein [Pseudohongiella sp.]|uniref:Uncharacterized protein n=1 Tax=marine sediment metagenome TaxID=412755 RepID=A0A0F9Y0I9_9ZZZZ|nr:hypothetical protein [Pseudohongiella sp.]HDZ10517.1 hypothetical protein [Pseudohongiella sp.]HEA63848.1 hypothetical protein [Pseudohongiella sp.]